eukprot:COSAG02_NODE_1620_length_11617_cov_3.185275_7_plen_1458_part_00
MGEWRAGCAGWWLLLVMVVLAARPVVVCGQCAAGERVDGAGCAPCPEGTAGDGTASSCSECPAGKSAPESGTEICSDCDTGTYQPDTGQAGCIDCSAGQVAMGDKTACEVCPPGRYSSPPSASPTSVCKTCPGGYRCPGNTDKIACRAGEFSDGRYPAVYTPDDASDDYTSEYEEQQNEAGPTSCEQCEAGMYTQEVASRGQWVSSPHDWVCDFCDLGYECAGGSDKQLCPAGKYAPGDSPACIACPAGQYSLEGAAMCTTCAAGHYCPGKLLTPDLRCCPGGTSVTPACPAAAQTYPTDPPGICTRELPGGVCTSGVTTDTCDGLGTGTCASACQRVSSLLCIPGTFSTAGQAYCENCAPGQYSYAGNTSCMPCAPGYFCAGGPVSEVAPRGNDAAFGDTSLQLSLLHTNQEMTPPDDLSSRQQCPNGTWSNNQRLLDASGNALVLAWCSNCSSGMFSGMGASSCTNCAPGKYSRSGWPVCQICGRSSFCPGGTDEIRCLPGYFSDDGAVECTGCPAGKYAQPGAANCTQCEQGYWCPGSTDKVSCGAGTWSKDTGASSAEACASCAVPAACLSGGRCRSGHQGDFCLSCQADPSPWYAIEDLCSPCPANTTLRMAIAGSTLFVFAIIVLWMGFAGKTRTSGLVGNNITVPFSILFTNLQIVMKLYELDLRWPNFVRPFIEDLEMFVDLDFASLSMTDPACSFKFENAGDGYRLHQNLVLLMLPVFCLCIAVLHPVLSCLMPSRATSGSGRIRDIPGEVSNACVAAFSTMFMGIAANVLEAFHCTTRVQPQLHMDQHTHIMCDFTNGSYLMIFSAGLLMLLIYILGLPLMIFMALSGRNRRWVPLDKENYVDPPNSFLVCWRSLKKCWVHTTTSPALLYAHAFQGEQSVRLVRKDKEKRLAATKENNEKVELQLETRIKGGRSHVCTHRCTLLPATVDREYESELDSKTHLSLDLSERIQGGKKAKKAAIKAAREAEEAYKEESDEEEKVVKKKIVKRKPKNTGTLNSYSYKDNSFKDGTSKPAGAPVRSKSSRKLRSDLMGPTSALKASSFADLHHAKEAKKKAARDRQSNVISTSSWSEQVSEGETKAAKSFRERQKAQSDGAEGGVKKVGLKSESFKKRMAQIGSVGSGFRAGGSFKDSRVVPESEAAKRAARKLKYSSYKSGWCRRGPPEYDVDEEETDGYIYWHASTREMLGWAHLRFRPECWWFEFVFMGRKLAVVAVTTYLDNVGEGYVALSAIAAITVIAFAAQCFFTPFPEDRAARYSKALCPCCSAAGLCSPHQGFFKYPVRVLLAFSNPSLNDLELAGLTCQLAILLCGLGCLVWGEDNSINGDNTTEQLTFVFGAASMCSSLLFVTLVLIFWCNAIRRRGQSTQVSTDVGNVGISEDEDEDEIKDGEEDEKNSAGGSDSEMVTPLPLDVEMADDKAGTEQQSEEQPVKQKLSGGSSTRTRKKKR